MVLGAKNGQTAVLRQRERNGDTPAFFLAAVPTSNGGGGGGGGGLADRTNRRRRPQSAFFAPSVFAPAPAPAFAPAFSFSFFRWARSCWRCEAARNGRRYMRAREGGGVLRAARKAVIHD